MLDHIDDISGEKRKQNLRENADLARLSKELATLKRDIDAGIDVNSLAGQSPDRSRLREVFARFELRDPLQPARGGARRGGRRAARGRADSRRGHCAGGRPAGPGNPAGGEATLAASRDDEGVLRVGGGKRRGGSAGRRRRRLPRC